jgi:purine-binding chemotaxis protein CheW
MNSQDSPLEEKAAELRRVFDRAFAEPPATSQIPFEDFLAIRVGPDAYAVRLAEISGLHADRKVTFLPSAVSELLGITGVRSAIVPVYDLRALFGYPPAGGSRWLLVAAEASVALAFDAFDGHLRLPKVASMPGDPGQSAAPFTCGVLTTGHLSRPLVDISSVLEAIRRRAQAALNSGGMTT